MKPQRKHFFSIDLKDIASRAMIDYGFQNDFPPGVLKEAASLKKKILVSPAKGVKDLRSLLWSSIDNVDSLDLDQLEHCERVSSSEVRVRVAIADVDHYVHKGSRTDQRAAHNGTSVYTGVKIFPMIPEALSNDLSSLMEDEVRSAVVMEYYVRKDGSVRFSGVYRALVKNKAKLIYEEVGAWLEGHGPVPARVASVPGLEEQVRLQDQAAASLRGFLREQGALQFETIEPRAVLEDGKVVDLVVLHKNRARYLIENFMIAANQTAVWFLEKHGVPVIQRVVKTPEHWARIVIVARELGHELPVEPDPGELSDFLIEQRRRDPERFQDLSLTIIKLLGPGEYALAEPGKSRFGHFGLAVYDYTHATAPNRRYIDVIVQRLVKAALEKRGTPYAKRELVEHAAWCTDRDKAAKKVERFMRKAAAAFLLRGREGEKFEAIVTGASEKGTYARITHPPVEGRVMRGEKGMRVGNKVRVRLVRLDPERAHIDFEG